MNRNKRKSSEIIERIEFKSEITKFLNDDQYAVILKIRSKRSARNTDRPNESLLKYVQTISNSDPKMTIQSKRLNADSKYFDGPIA